MVKLCVFDLDGTLVDTLSDLTNSLNYALAECGQSALSEAQVSAIVGHSITYMCENSVPPEQIALAPRILELFKAHYAEHSLDCSRPYDGMIDAVLAIKRAGVKVAVVSNKPHDDAVRVVARLYPKNTFSLVLGRTHKFEIKPAPDSLNFAMDFFGVTPDESVYVGDSDVDVEFARNAGMRCVSVTWGFRSVGELLTAGAVCMTDDPKKVPDLVLSAGGEHSC
ncbi:MAG: HAD family hydrolase [Clostridiaceae bacterium]